MIGETHVFDPVQWATLYGEQLDEMHLPVNFGLLRAPVERADASAPHVDAIEAALPARRLAELRARQPRRVADRDPRWPAPRRRWR